MQSAKESTPARPIDRKNFVGGMIAPSPLLSLTRSGSARQCRIARHSTNKLGSKNSTPPSAPYSDKINR